jgi:hypothetical protein
MELLDFIAYYSWCGLPLSVLFFLRTKDEKRAERIIYAHKVLFLIWFIRGGLDYFLGINFYGRLLDYIVEYFFPWAIIICCLYCLKFEKKMKKWQIPATIFVYSYNLLYVPLLFVMMVIDRPLVGHKFYPREVYNGTYFKIEQSGSEISMSDNFKGTDIRYYRKYFLLERRIKHFGFYNIDTIFNIDEQMSLMKYDVKFGGISDTLRGMSIKGW